jgi:hypothetical protein
VEDFFIGEMTQGIFLLSHPGILPRDALCQLVTETASGDGASEYGDYNVGSDDSVDCDVDDLFEHLFHLFTWLPCVRIKAYAHGCDVSSE